MITLSQDPLDKWYVAYKMQQKQGRQPSRFDTESLDTTLDSLAAFLERSKGEKVSFSAFESELFAHSLNFSRVEDSDIVAKAQHIYRSLLHARGTGINFMQQGILNLITQSIDPSTIPFWLELLDFKKSHDSFARERKRIALASIAFIALVRQDSAAYAALQQATKHTDPTVREEAIWHLTRCYMMQEKELPQEVQTLLYDIAMSDKVFVPRFFARMALWSYDLDVPQDNPDGVYELKVSFLHDTQKTMYRTIAIYSDQTLEDLHLAIQDELDWDNDHLYTFFVTGRMEYDPYEFSNPGDPEAEFYTTEGIIGCLGLVLKHKFVYLFDYGDSHMFSIEVVGIHPQVDEANDDAEYPRVIDSRGDAPVQYPMLEDEYDDDLDFDGDDFDDDDDDDDDDFDDDDEVFNDTFNGTLPDDGGGSTYKNNGTHI